MPNQHDVNKVVVSTQVTEEDNRRLDKLAEEAEISKAKLIGSILHEQLSDVPLTAEDYELIAGRIRAKIEKLYPKEEEDEAAEEEVSND